MTNNNDKKVLESSIEREQNEFTCSAEHEKIKGPKNLNVPPLRFPEFTGEWETKSINDLADVIGGGTPDTTVKSYWDGEIQWFTPSEIGKNKFVDASLRTITEDGLNNSSAKLLPPNTILLSSRATIGECSLSLRECATNQGFQSLISKKCNVDFLYYLIQTKKKDLIRKSCGSTFLEISANEVRKIQVSVPSDVEQQKIAGLLSLIDKRIATQNKIIEKLESLMSGIRHNVFTRLQNGNLYKLGEFLTEYSERNRGQELPSVAVGKYGIRKRTDIYSKELSKDYSNNKVIYKNTLTIGMGSSQIDIGILLGDEIYCVSPAYTTYRIHDINPAYLQEYLIHINSILSFKYMITSVRQGKSVNKSALLQHKIFPDFVT